MRLNRWTTEVGETPNEIGNICPNGWQTSLYQSQASDRDRPEIR
jgi:hypothetical protein